MCQQSLVRIYSVPEDTFDSNSDSSESEGSDEDSASEEEGEGEQWENEDGEGEGGVRETVRCDRCGHTITQLFIVAYILLCSIFHSCSMHYRSWRKMTLTVIPLLMSRPTSEAFVTVCYISLNSVIPV